MALTLIGPMYSELPQQRCWHRVGFVALVCLGKKLALDLSGTHRHVTHYQFRAGVADDACARNARQVIMPRMAPEP